MNKLLPQLLPIILIGGLILSGWYFFIRESPDTRWKVTNFPPSGGSTWVAFGDSLVFGAEVNRNETWSYHVGQHYGVNIINAGKNGDETGDALKRLDAVLALNPEVVLLGIGGNDMLRKKGAEEMGRNLETLVSDIQETGAMVVLTGVDGSIIYGGEYRDEFERVARDTGCVFVDNIMSGVIGNRSYLLADNVHPNAAGYKFIADRVIRECDPWLRPIAMGEI